MKLHFNYSIKKEDIYFIFQKESESGVLNYPIMFKKEDFTPSSVGDAINKAIKWLQVNPA